MFARLGSFLTSHAYTKTFLGIPYNADLDGLRGLAVLFVFLHHLFPTRFVGGFIGVDVFFVISGFLISKIILAQLDAGSFNFFTFYARRIRRLFPALIITCTLCFMYGWLVLFPNEFIALSKHIIGAVFFLSNLLLYREIGYFDPSSTQKPLLHLWSLAIEEQFYVIWPLLLWGIFYVTRRKFLTSFYSKIVLAAMLAATILGFCLHAYLSCYHPHFAFYFTGARLWELSLGALGAWYAQFGQKIKIPTRAQEWISFSSIAIILISFFVLDHGTMYFPFFITLPVLSTLFLLLGSETTYHSSVRKYVLTQPILVCLGLISYPMYLLHWPCISFFHIISESALTLCAKLCILLFVIGASYGIYRYIETPIRKKTSGLSVGVCVGLMGILGVLGQLGYVSYVKTYLHYHSPDSEKISKAIDDWEYPTKNMKKMVSDNRILYTLGPAPHRILFLGDSNAWQYAPRVDQLITSGKSKKSAIFVAAGGGPFLNVGANPKLIS